VRLGEGLGHPDVVLSTVIADSPTPNLPRGAGGSLRRAAGRVLPPLKEPKGAAAALVLEPDPLMRLLVVSAAAALGFRVLTDPDGAGRDSPPSVAVVFVPLTQSADCRGACAAARARAGGAAPLIAGYGAGPPALLAAHRAHRCADLVLLLTAADCGARFAHLPAADEVSAAGLTEREADVLVLLLEGLTTPAISGRLCVSSSTARTHCRAVLRKLGAGDRRALRARFLAGPSRAQLRPSTEPPASLSVAASPAPCGAGFEVCPDGHANFAEE
jgi:DNA-binding CsgD family transcriptional regulator